MRDKFGIKVLRGLGGTWQAHRNGMSSYSYTGEMDGHSYRIYACSHLAAQFDGDDDSSVVLWHMERDGKAWGVPTSDPTPQLTGEYRNE